MSALGTGNIIIGFKVEGMGKTSAVPTVGGDAAHWRFTTGLAGSTLDPQGLYKDWIVKDSLPDIEFSTDYRTGHFVIGDATFEILCKVDDADLDPRELFLQTYHTSIGKIGVTLTSSGTTVVLTGATSNITGLDGVEIGVSRERIRLGTEDTTGIYLDCTRNIHGTPALAVNVDNPAHNLDVYRTFHRRQRRLVTLFYLDLETATSLSDEVVLWQGALDTCGRPDYTRIQIKCLGLTSLLKSINVLPNPWQAEIEQFAEFGAFVGNEFQGTDRWTCSLKAVDDYGDESALTPLAMDSSPTASESFTYVWLRGSIYKMTYTGGSGLNRRYTILLEDPQFETREVKRGDLRAGDRVHEVYVVDPDAPGVSGGPTSVLMPMGGTYGDVLTALKQVMTSSAHGANGAFDMLFDFGLGIPPAMIDFTTFDAVRERLGDQLIMPRTFFGNNDTPVEFLKKVTEEILLPNQLAWTTTAAGALGIDSLRDLEDPDETITHIDGSSGDVLGLCTYASGDDRILGKVEAVYNRKGDGKGTRIRVPRVRDQGDLLSPMAKADLDCGGWSSSVPALGAIIAYIERWGEAVPLIGLEAQMSADAQVGALVKVTVADVFDVANGVVLDEGITEGRMHVASKRLALSGESPHLVYTLLYTGQRLDKLGRIGAAGQVVSWDGPSKALTLTTNYFVPSDGGVYTRDAEAFAADDVLVLLDQYGTVRGTGGEVSGTPSGDVLTISPGFSATPSPGDIVIAASWDDLTAAQKAAWIAISDTDGVLGTSDDAGFNYQA